MYVRDSVVSRGWCGLQHWRRASRRVSRCLQRGGRRAPRRRARCHKVKFRLFDWQHPGSVLRCSFGPAYALATARRDQDQRVFRVPGYHTWGHEPANQVIDPLATHDGFQEAVFRTAEPFNQRHSDRQTTRLLNEWLQPEYPSSDLAAPAEPQGACANYLYLTYGSPQEDEEKGRTYGERLNPQMAVPCTAGTSCVP